MRRRDQFIIAAEVLVLVALVGHIVWNHVQREARETTYRRQLIQLGTSINPCMNVEAAALVLGHRPPEGFRVLGGQSDGWVVITPPRLGAKNWTLTIDVAANRVTQVRYRTEDSATEHPGEAPPDRQC
jgi:hypothetical protein